MPSYPESIDTSLVWLGLATFITSLLVHVLIWRRLQINRHFLMLLVIFLGLPVVGYGMLSDARTLIPLSFHLILAVNYIAIYPAFQAASPTIQILAFLAHAPGGLTRSELASKMQAENLVDARLKDLHRAGLLSSDAQPVLSWGGRWLAKGFLTYRAVLGLPVGQG